MIDYYYRAVRDKPLCILNSTDTIILPEKQIDNINLYINNAFFEFYEQKNKFYARKKGERYRFSEYKIQYQDGKMRSYNIITSNLKNHSNNKIIEQIIEEQLLEINNVPNLDYIIYPFYLFEEDQLVEQI